MKSRWTDDQDDLTADAERRREREEKKEKKERAKAEKQRRFEEEEEVERHRFEEHDVLLEEDGEAAEAAEAAGPVPAAVRRPAKRRKLSSERANVSDETESVPCLRFTGGEWGPCRHVDNYEKLNHIEEGSYGWVSRAREMATGEVVALKKLKVENTNDGLPVTGLREIQTLMESRHPHIVHLKEVVVGSNLNEYDWHRSQ